jgi:SAM-dependent methyltransferase
VKKKWLNLGCDVLLHSDWINLDLVPRPEVLAADLRNGIPFRSNSLDVVYHSHVLEHFRRSEGRSFISECHRVLKPGGVIRIGIPDLEQMARIYLEKLEAALTGDRAAAADYEWILLEMYDQVVREVPGGDMLAYMMSAGVVNEKFIIERFGKEAHGIFANARRLHAEGRFRPQPTRENDPLRLSRFRMSGELHFWMYDRHSLGRILEETDFCGQKVVAADESRIPEFRSYCLDMDPEGRIRKPSTIFMEAVKKGGS